ncbi:MAG: hypothetical protein KBA61_01230 [Spirochaetes bacterium]|jgi:hypothetical protein|nr:hypothetical protein [Spirochaetota bacterium]
MNIKTTLYLDNTSIESIRMAAEAAGLDTGQVVMALVRRCASDAKRRPCTWSRVRYQERKGGVSRRRMHVAVNPDGYEYSIDLRKMLKMSVSFIVAEAVKLYLDEVLAILLKTGDNYCYRNYAMLQFSVDDVICWILCWGIPRKTFPIRL